ncbi:unnamed protein product [Calypogeia fissa]
MGALNGKDDVDFIAREKALAHTFPESLKANDPLRPLPDSPSQRRRKWHIQMAREWLDAKRTRLMYEDTNSVSHYFKNSLLKWKEWKTQHKKDSIAGFKERIFHVLMTEDGLPKDKARAMGRIDELILDTSDEDCHDCDNDRCRDFLGN